MCEIKKWRHDLVRAQAYTILLVVIDCAAILMLDQSLQFGPRRTVGPKTPPLPPQVPPEACRDRKAGVALVWFGMVLAWICFSLWLQEVVVVVENVGCQVDASLEQACCGGGMRAAAASAGEIYFLHVFQKKLWWRDKQRTPEGSVSFKASSEHRDDDVASVAAACSSIAIRAATLRGERWRRTTALQVLNRAVCLYCRGCLELR